MRIFKISPFSFLALIGIGFVVSSTLVGPPAVTSAAPQTAGLASNAPTGDVAELLRGKIDRDTMSRLRDDHVRALRGLPHNLPYDPRSRAVAEIERIESSAEPSRQSSVWQPIGPAPIRNGQAPGLTVPVSGRVTAIAVHPTNPDIAYVGTAGGGVYRTLNGGRTWTPIFDGAQSLAVGAVAIAPSQPTTVFVGTGDSSLSLGGVGVYRIDNAETNPVLVGPMNKNTAGQDVLTGNSVSELLVHPTDPNTIFVSTIPGTAGLSGNPTTNAPPLGLFRSTNAMSSSTVFTKLLVPTGVTNRPITDMVFEPGNPNVLICFAVGAQAAGDGGAWRTTDALAPNPTFTQTIQRLIGRVELGIQKTGERVTIIAATSELDTRNNCTPNSSGNVRRSTDGGLTWSQPIAEASGFCGGQCLSGIAVAVSPADPNLIYLGGQSNGNENCRSFVLGKSTDGTTFTPSDRGLPSDTQVIALAPSNPSIIYTGNGGGVFKSTDAGATWANLNTETFSAAQLIGLAVHPTDRNFIVAGTVGNGTILRDANGNWTRVDADDGGFVLIDRNATDTSNVTTYHTYFNVSGVLSGFARVTRTACAKPGDWVFRGCGSNRVTTGCEEVPLGAANGIDCTEPVFLYTPMALGPGNPNTLYFGTDRLYRSTNRGDAMEVVSQPLVPQMTSTPARPISAIAVSPRDDKVRLVGTSNGKVFVTTSGETELKDITGPIPPAFIGRVAIDPKNAKTAYVTLNTYGLSPGQHIWKTTSLDAPKPTWTPSSSGIPDVPVNALLVDPEKTSDLYAGTDIGMFRSTDGGASWTSFNAGLPRLPVFDIALQNSNRLLRIATHGRGVWETQLERPPDTEAPTVRVTAPNGGENLTGGDPFTITWTSEDNVGVTEHAIALSLDGGATFPTTAATGVAGDANSFQWTVSNQATARARIRVTAGDAMNNRGSDASDADFSIAPSPDFALAALPSAQTVAPGDSATFSVAVNALNGFRNSVNVSARATPNLDGVSVSLSTTSVSAGGSATLNVLTSSATPTGEFTVTVTGSADGRTRATSVKVVVAAPDFALGFDSPTLTIQRGGKGSIVVKINRTGGFAGNVTVAAPDVKPLKLKLTPAAQSSTGTSVSFTYKAKSGSVVGTHQLTFTGTDGAGRTRTAVLSLTIQ